MIIYSFDDVLRAPKAIHSIELTPGGSKVPMWRPVPWIGFLYFMVVELVFVIAAHLPIVDVFSELFAPVVYYAAFPVGVVWLVLNVEFDGRAPHRWIVDYLYFLARPKRTISGRARGITEVKHAGKVRFWWDVSAPRLHHGWVKGGSLSTTVGAKFTHAVLHTKQVLTTADQRSGVCDHEVVDRLEIRP